MPSKRYEIMRDFVDGFVAALRPSAIDNTKSEHWHAGYAAGYQLKAEKHRLLDEYLVSIGEPPQAIIRAVECTVTKPQS